MAIIKHEVTVVRTDVYHIEIDDEIFNEEMREEWSKHFHQLDSVKDIAVDIAIMHMRDPNVFQEGYGYINVDGDLPWCLKYRENVKATVGLNIIEHDTDQNYETEIKEL